MNIPRLLPASMTGHGRLLALSLVAGLAPVPMHACGAETTPPMTPSAPTGTATTATATSPADSSSAPADSAPVDDAGPSRFYIRNFRVLGTHFPGNPTPPLSMAEIEAIVYPFMGPYRTNDDVEAARTALEKAYQDKGYQTISVLAPAQTLNALRRNGVVVLEVSQLPVGRLRVVGARYYLPSRISEQAGSMAVGTVPNFNEVSRDIISLNQLPDRQVTPVLRAGEFPNTVDIDLDVKDKFPFHGSVEFNNRFSANTTDLRTNVSLDYDNLWQLGHSLSAAYQVAPENPSDASVYTASYLARIPGVDWLNILAYGTKSNSNVNTLGTVNVVGKGKVIGGRFIIALPNDKGFSESLSLGLDYKSYHQAVAIGQAAASDTPIVYLPLSSTYSASWQGGDGSLTQIDAGVTLSLRGLGSSSQEKFTEDRFGSSADFIYFRGDISRTQPLPKDFQLYGKFQTQVASEALVNDEQIGAGGLDTVRGYLESEDLGDNGVIGQIELRTSSIGTLNPAVVDDWRLYIFGDGAELGLNDALRDQQTTFNLASVGLGTRLKLFDHFNGSVDAALPLIAGPDTPLHAWRLTFRAQAAF